MSKKKEKSIIEIMADKLINTYAEFYFQCYDNKDFKTMTKTKRFCDEFIQIFEAIYKMKPTDDGFITGAEIMEFADAMERLKVLKEDCLKEC